MEVQPSSTASVAAAQGQPEQAVGEPGPSPAAPKVKTAGSRLPVGPIAFDVVATAVAAVAVIYLMYQYGKVPARGFVCNDYSIRYAYVDSVIASIYVCAGVTVFVIVVPVVIVELIRVFKPKCFEQQPSPAGTKKAVLFFIRFAKYSGSCAIGLVVNLAISRVPKYTVGRLRPFFLDICSPKNMENSSDWTSCQRNITDGAFVQTYECTGDRKLEVFARQSFYCARASYLMHAAAYIAMYFHERLPERMYCYTFRPLLQIAFIFVALFLSYSLIGDRHHFISDVFVGFLVGIVTAAYSALHIARMFRKESKASGGDATLWSGNGAAEPEPAADGVTTTTAMSSSPGTQTDVGPRSLSPYKVCPAGTDPSMMTDADSVLQSSTSPLVH